jgi:urease accessory protein
MVMHTEEASLLLLLNWMSPTFPIGSFAYSHGLESAIVDGRIADAGALEGWLRDLIQLGSGWNDAVLFSLCWTEDPDRLNAIALAMAGSAERYLETTHLGKNFSIAACVWTGEKPPNSEIAYPIAAGMACVSMGIPQKQALVAYLQGFCAALVSAAVRLVPLGQTRGLEVLRNLATVISSVALRATMSTTDDLGSCCFAADIAAMQHETLQPRIFRT